jgi:predicted nucleic-acid-binding protein
MRAIDTNVLVRLIVRDNENQVDLAEEFVSHGAWVCHLVLAETAWVLDSVYGRSPIQIADAIEKLLRHQHLTLQDSDSVERALENFREKPALGFSDSLVVEISRKAGHLPLGTFDRNLGKADGTERLY